MLRSLDKVPFLRLLLPLVGGIIFQYYICIVEWSIILLILGLGVMLFSFVISPSYQYKLRWIFGLGLYLFLFAIGIISTSCRQQQVAFKYEDSQKTYLGVVTDIPQRKQNSIACKVYLEELNKKIICYFQPGVRSKKLQAGDKFYFIGKINPFKNLGNPDDFDYKSYMYNKGFSGYVYLFSDDWEGTGTVSSSITTQALRLRQKILEYYQSIGLSNDEYAIISSLTLGYKDAISDELKEAFRTTGTAHILALSGMHVAIIYGLIMFPFTLLRIPAKYNWVKTLCIIIILWAYVFITGISPSVSRAAIMLSIFSFATLFNRKGFSYNTLSIAAFFILLSNPFTIFDLGFQLSFSAVFSIIFLHPKLINSIKIKNTILKKIWEALSLSLVAQLGTFPLCLYYFGTFPTYFFITNLIVVPMVSIIIYNSISLSFLGALSHIIPCLSTIALKANTLLLKATIISMTETVRFFENLPFALIQNIHISLIELTLLICLIISSVLFILKKKASLLITTLVSITLLFTLSIWSKFESNENKLIVYNRKDTVDVRWCINKQKFALDTIVDFHLLHIGEKRFLTISKNIWENMSTSNKFEIDYMHVVTNNSISLYSLTQLFNIDKIIIDGSLSNKNRNKLIKECENLKLSYHDVSEKGAFRIFF